MKVLFAYAHLDDETILSYGTMRRFVRENHDVRILTMCRGRAGQSQDRRLAAYDSIMAYLKVSAVCGGYDDLSLTENAVKGLMREQIADFKPELLITHSPCDLHFEHRMLADCSLLEVRQTKGCGIKKLWQTVSQTNSWTYGRFGTFQPNVFVDVSEFMSEKLQAVSMYADEIPADNLDNRSVDAVMMWNRMHGCAAHAEFVEPYAQVFEKI